MRLGELARPAVCSIGINDELDGEGRGGGGEIIIPHRNQRERRRRGRDRMRRAKQETEDEFASASCLHVVDFALHLNLTHPILSNSSISSSGEFHG